MTKPLLAVFLVMLANALLAHHDIFVHPAGDDRNPGTVDQPCQTLERARELARTQRRQKTAVPIHIILKPGRYYLPKTILWDRQDAGTQQAPLVIRAQHPGTVFITGATRIPSQAFRKVTSPQQLKRLDPQAAPHIRVANLLQLGFAKQPPVILNPCRAITRFPEVFFNGQRMTLARWPDGKWAEISSIVDPGSKMHSGGIEAPKKRTTPPVGGTFQFREDRPLTWNTAEPIILRGYWCFDWSEEVVKLDRLDPKNKTIKLAKQPVYGLRHGNPSPRRWYAMNIPSELTQPGEFFLDDQTDDLFIYPMRPLEQSTVTITTNRGRLFQLRNTSHIAFQNLVFEEAMEGIYVFKSEHIDIQGCIARNLHWKAFCFWDCKHSTVHSCDVYHTGIGGIAFAGGDYKNLIPQHNLVENCDIYDFSVHKLCYSHGLKLEGIGNTARHNEIHHVVQQPIGMVANDNRFEYNVVHDVCLAADDSGGIHKGRNPSKTGNVIRYNFWYSIGKPMGHGIAAIYFDDGDVGETVYGNVFFRAGEPGKGSFGTIFSHGGHGHTAENNVFIECKRALGSAPWNDKRWLAMIKGKLWQTRLLKDVDITKPPYVTKYPWLKGFMDPKPGAPRVSHAKNNLFVMCADVKSGNWMVDDSNWSTDQDPGFVDMAGGNFELRNDAPVFRKMPGFKPIPFQKMGLYPGTFRPQESQCRNTARHRPVFRKRAWTLPPPKKLPPLKAVRTATENLDQPNREAPQLKVPQTDKPPVADGIIAPGEWNARPFRLASTVYGEKLPDSQAPKAWIQRDEHNLYVAVSCPLRPQDTILHNQWGQDHAVEFAIKPDPRSPQVTVARGFANGFLYFGIAPSGQENPLNQEPAPAQFAARRTNETTWTAEFVLPFEKLNLDRNNLKTCYFNLSVRNPSEDLWIMWSPTRSYTTNVIRAARLTW